MSFARVRALVILGVLVVLALVFIVVALVRDSQSGATATGGCGDGEIPANVALRKPEEIKINVLNGTATPGLADSVATTFANRKFQVVKKGNDKRAEDKIAVLRYGPKAVGSAHLLRAYFLDNATTEYNPARTDDVVDVVIGPRFQQLATTTEVNQSLAGLGQPQLPPGTCVGDGEG